MAATYPAPEDLKGAVQGTLLYLSLYLFGFITFQSFSKFYLFRQKKQQAKADAKKHGTATTEKVSFRAVKYYNSRDMLALAGDRTVGNFLEFAIVFLPLYWMHAVLVDPTMSWTIALAYTVPRGLYPLLMLYAPTKILLSTLPGYVVLFYLMWEIATKYAFV